MNAKTCFGTILVVVSVLFPLASWAGRGFELESAWNTEAVAVGDNAMTVIDAQGRIHVVFNSQPPTVLRYGVKSGDWWNFRLVDTDSINPSIALNPNETPAVSYYRQTDRSVRFANLGGTNISSETVETVNGTVLDDTSLAIDTSGRPHVAYWNMQGNLSGYLRHAYRSMAGWIVETVLFAARPFPSMSIALDSQGHPAIGSIHMPLDGLSYSEWNGSAWSTTLVDKPEKGIVTVGALSLKFDSSNHARIAYQNLTGKGMRFARFESPVEGWKVETVYQYIGLGGSKTEVSLALDKHGLPRISFIAADSLSLRYAHFDGVQWTVDMVDATFPSRIFDSLALGPHDEPHIFYVELLSDGSEQVTHKWLDVSDGVPPSSRAEAVRPYWHNHIPLQLTATASDVGSVVSNVTLWFRHSLDNITWDAWLRFATRTTQPWGWQFTFPGGEGHYRFYTTATDAAGNTETPPSSADAFAAYDITPPALTITPNAAWVPAGTSFSLDASDGLGSGVATVEYRIDEGQWIPYSATFPLSEGSHTIEYRSCDHVGNEVQRKLTIEVTSAPPLNGASVNCKPIIAGVFAIVLVIAGLLSSWRKP